MDKTKRGNFEKAGKPGTTQSGFEEEYQKVVATITNITRC
jgi:hypothetical protein